ncbi:MAG: protein kinase, partial [Eggerthellaceae bacterium]|nr:protein kinase [Eggerthellaceae bacterium]
MSDDLSRYLDSLERESRYRVEAVLKESDFETTQRVFLADGGAERGPFIRKFIKRDKGLGVAYERIYEAQLAGRTFKHMPSILECYPHDENTVVVMEFVEGETLQDLVYRLDPSVELAQAVFPPLCDAVRELHESFDPPLIHRDLKPSNVIVSFDSAEDNMVLQFDKTSSTQCKVTIIDFGIAREYDEEALEDTAHFGTRDFAPPEQFGYGQTSESSDVYALGLLLFFCLT